MICGSSKIWKSLIRIPVDYKDDPKLGNWVKNVRYARRKEKLSEVKEKLLDEIGFELVCLEIK